MVSPRESDGRRRALIIGITGQDGYYLAHLLATKGYEIFGLVRPATHRAGSAYRHDLPPFTTIVGDLADQSSLVRAVETSRPHEIYNLGGVTSVRDSVDAPAATATVNGLAVLHLLDAIASTPGTPPPRFFQASSAEMYGVADHSPQTEDTPFRPSNPYAYAKVLAHYATVDYRNRLGLFTATGICFNHESPRRRGEFVMRKVSRAVAEIKLGMRHDLGVADLATTRDWGFAGDFVEAMWRALQHDEPGDYVLATGHAHSIEDLVAAAFAAAGIDNWRERIVVEPSQQRPDHIAARLGDPTKAERVLGWQRRVTFERLVAMMVEHDLEQLQTRSVGRDASRST